MSLHVSCATVCTLILFGVGSAGTPPPHGYFVITVIDQDTGRGVPLVELRTTNRIRYYTDSNGIVAFYEPGLMDTDVYFHVKSHGYSYPKDRFGYAGTALRTVEGGGAEIRIKRDNVAERLYRITGQGIYADSVLVGHPIPIEAPAINGLVLGQDSVLSAVYKGKLYWFWGDTDRPAYPLGNFHTSGATSALPGKGGLDPEVGVDLAYFTDERGFSKKMMPFDAPGPVWLGGLVTIVGKDGGERLFAMYSNVDTTMKAQEIGIAEYDDEMDLFVKVKQLDLDAPIKPGGHPFRATESGVEYICFSPVTRVRADEYALLDPSRYEGFTCLKRGSRKDSPEVERDSDGRAVFGWKPDTWTPMPQEEAGLVKDGKIRDEDALFHIRDSESGKALVYHGGTVAWNEYRKRWVMIMQEAFGTSFLGETWYLEADTPQGPWVYARKIVTHENYSFYNPRHHPMLDKEGGRVIFFDGTYTRSFTDNDDPTPRYEYNQIMYKLDLADERLALPVPIYESGEILGTGGGIAFFALDRPARGTVPVYLVNGELTAGAASVGEQGSEPVFHALPHDAPDPPATTTSLYEFARESDGRKAYSTQADWPETGYRRSDAPVCLVWKNPVRLDSTRK